MNVDTLEIAQRLTEATLVRIEDDGSVYVDFSGNEHGPVRARLAYPGDVVPNLRENMPVLVLLDGADRRSPVIIGTIRDRLPDAVAAGVAGVDRGQPAEVRTDGRQLRFSATDQVVIECGRASIKLASDGSIEIKGARIVSRSSGIHKIRGANVRIN
jgi:hypothetical protein